MDYRDIWRRNFVVLLCWILFYQVTQILILEISPVSILPDSTFYLLTRTTKPCPGGTALGLFTKETSETRKLNIQLRERKAGRRQTNVTKETESETINTKGVVT
jgi:ATP-binding cassette, subfamily G (WHITE), member 2, SNQ2